MGYRFAIVGATGNVGTEMLEILAESDIEVDEVFAVASRKSVGRVVSFGDKEIKCVDLETFDFSKCDIALMSAGGDVSKTWSPKIAAAGAIVIDNSSAWRMDPDVPLVVPEVNASVLAEPGALKKGIIANPNCSTIQMVVALKPLLDRATTSVLLSRLISLCQAAVKRIWMSYGSKRNLFSIRKIHSRPSISPSKSLLTLSRILMCSWMVATPKKSGK